MKIRVFTGLAILFPAAYVAGWAPKWLFMAVLIALVERGLYEYFFIARQGGLKIFPVLGYAAGAAVCLAQWAGLGAHSSAPQLGTLMAFIVLVPSLGVWMAGDSAQYLTAISATLFGILYVGFAFSCLFPLRFSMLGFRLANGRQILFFLLAVICVGDIFAYLTGRAFGRRLMFARISPKKTVEGAIGGLGASIVVGLIYTRVFWRTSDWRTVILLAGCIAVAGQVGDLAESALKRSANLKDSGALLPGHGGLLDRVDSLLLGAPLFWLFLVAESLLRSSGAKLL
jgi:phosphatidate cytidylyltransferase